MGSDTPGADVRMVAAQLAVATRGKAAVAGGPAGRRVDREDVPRGAVPRPHHLLLAEPQHYPVRVRPRHHQRPPVEGCAVGASGGGTNDLADVGSFDQVTGSSPVPPIPVTGLRAAPAGERTLGQTRAARPLA